MYNDASCGVITVITGILVIVTIGVAIGIFCGGLLLSLAAMYLKRFDNLPIYFYESRPILFQKRVVVPILCCVPLTLLIFTGCIVLFSERRGYNIM